ncbi:MAG: S16 family serine protease [Actinomycetota bacterium]
MNRSLLRVLALVPALAALIVVAIVPLPLFAIAPGPARDVFPRIRVEGAEVYPSEGQLLLTTVTYGRASVPDAISAWLDEFVVVVPERLLFPPGRTQQEETRIQLSQMDESKLTAASVALARVAGYPRRHGRGALVRRVEPGSPADGRLFPGDLIVRVDGRPVGSADDVVEHVRRVGASRAVEFTVRVEDQTRTVGVRAERPGDGGDPRIGVEGTNVLDNFPFSVLIESGDIGGPSAGLMWSVGLIDLLTPGDLTAGRRIAGTGTIDLDGNVGPIGGIGQKVVAAERSGATVFLVPRADHEGARAAGTGLELVPVDHLEDALAYLSRTCRCPGV